MADIFKVIFQLEADGQGVLNEINAVAGQYKKVNTELKNQEKELNVLLKKEADILALRKKTNSPSEAAKYSEQLKKNKAAIDGLKKSTNELVQAEKDVVKESETIAKKLDNAFKGTQVKSLRTQLKELKAQLATTDDDQEFLKLSIQAGKLEDKIGDASNAARIFATDSPFEAVGNAIGNVGTKLLALDFEGAAQGSQLLVKASQQISFKTALTGIKQLGQTLFNVGKALLTNPLFLIGAAVALIIANFDKLKSSGGFIGTIFKTVGLIIEGVTETFFALTDAIGLTSHALDELNAKKLSNLTKQIEADSKTLDNFAKILKAQGKDTEEIEKRKNQLIADNSKKQIDILRGVQKAKGSLSEEDQKLLDESIARESDALTELKVIEFEGLEKRKATQKKYAEDVSKIFTDLNKKLREEQNQAADLANKTKFGEGSIEQINAVFALRKKVEADQFKELQKQSLQEVKTSADKEKAKLLLSQIRIQQEKNLETEKAVAILDAENNIAVGKLERERANNEQLLAASEDSELGIARQKFLIQQDYYDKVLILAQQDIERRKALGFDTSAQEKALVDLKIKAKSEQSKGLEELNKMETDSALKQVEEKESQANTQLKLQNARNSALLFNQLKYEKDNLAILEAGGEKYLKEYEKQKDKIALLEKEAIKTQRLENISYFETIINAAISATNKILDVKINEINKQTELQQKRVDDAKNIASEGNAELLQEEKNRLERLNKEKEKFVRQQQALAAVELVANTAIAVSKAAAEGGAAAGITIAAALLALVAGLASARSIASQAAFYEGGLYDAEGYTGAGNPRDASSKVGRKPYIYHKDEFIFNHKNTRKYKDIFQGVHEGRIDLREWADKVKAFDGYRMDRDTRQHSPIVHTTVEIGELKSQMESLINIVKNQSTSVNMDDNGFALHLKRVVSRNEFIRNLAK